jgi:hypothetical protein
MSGINFLSENLADVATLSITTGSENAQFPLSNLKNNTTTRKFRSVGNTVVIVADLLQTRAIDTFALVGDATGSFGVTSVSIKTSVTLDFSSSTSIPIAISATENIGYEFITPVSRRYVEITLTGTGSFSEISKIFIGERINLPDLSLSIDSFGYGRQDLSKVKENDFGQRFIDKRNKVKLLDGGLEFATLTEQEILDDMFTVHGISEPLWIIIDPNSDAINDGQFKLAMYGYMDKMPKWDANGGKQYSTSIKMSEVI